MFTPQWSAKIEYDYQDFGTRSVYLCDPAGCAIADYRQKVQLVIVGLNFRFNPFAR